jgi:hypothetical protein
LPVLLCVFAPIFVLGCAQTAAPGPVPAPPAPAGGAERSAAPSPLYSMFHRALAAPQGATEQLRLHAKGVQIFRCEMRAGVLRWVYRLPEAELRDDAGTLAVHHGANQTFEHVDGSRLVGEVVDHVPSPLDNALPWLLLKTRSFGKGSLSAISYVQRVNTVGGMPPENCDPTQTNQLLRIDFSADFVFFQ